MENITMDIEAAKKRVRLLDAEAFGLYAVLTASGMAGASENLQKGLKRLGELKIEVETLEAFIKREVT